MTPVQTIRHADFIQDYWQWVYGPLRWGLLWREIELNSKYDKERVGIYSHGEV